MKKQTKLVAVLSTASLLAIGASMTSFAATGWVEENGTWVYYDRDEQRVTDQWARSGNGWYYLDENGEMATDRLIEDDGKYYYVDTNGVMVTNQWVAIENEDAGEDDEPDHYWYYFQANGRAMTNGNNNGVALKTINGKKYAFDDEGKMLYGWVDEDDAERLDNTDGDAFMDGDYYFGGPDDGAMTTGWLQVDITYDDATNEDYMYISPVFHDDEDQTRWFWFASNGKKVKADDGEEEKQRSINGRRYAFDEYGAMIAEWSLDVDEIESASGSFSKGGEEEEFGGIATANLSATSVNARAEHAQYTQNWRYFSDVEDGARISRGWFKVVPAEYLDESVYDDDEPNWYYADGSGNLYAGEFKTINGRKFAFRNDGRCIFGLNFIREEEKALEVMASDDATYAYDNVDDFDDNAPYLEEMGYRAYYFGETGDAPTDGAMRTGRQTVSIDGENYTFYFETSGGKKGQGVTGEEDDRYYQSGKLLAAGSDERYQVVSRWTVNYDDVIAAENDNDPDTKVEPIYAYYLVEDVDELLKIVGEGNYKDVELNDTNAETDMGDAYNISNLNQDGKDLDELYVFGLRYKKDAQGNLTNTLETDASGNLYADGLSEEAFFLVNTSGRVVDNRGKSKDGNDYYFVTGTNGEIKAIYLED